MKQNDLLLVTDMQNAYKKGGKWECLDTEGVAENINKIIAAGIKNVIFTRFIADTKNPRGAWKDYNKKYDDVNRDEHANLMLDSLKEPLSRFPLYTKHVYSSLSVPEVLEACRKAGRVVITGVVAECCVLSTVFALMDEGIHTVYITDAVSGLTRQKEDATLLVFEGLSPLHVQMMSCEEYLLEKQQA